MTEYGAASQAGRQEAAESFSDCAAACVKKEEEKTTANENDIAASVTRWLKLFFKFWQFATIKICPRA